MDKLNTPIPFHLQSSHLLNVNQVAELLSCSPRTVYRQVDAGKIPRPRKIGSLNRWPRKELDTWIENGCKPVRSALR